MKELLQLPPSQLLLRHLGLQKRNGVRYVNTCHFGQFMVLALMMFSLSSCLYICFCNNLVKSTIIEEDKGEKYVVQESSTLIPLNFIY
jgi:hypothetical protein